MTTEVTYEAFQLEPNPVTGAVNGVYSQNLEHAAEAYHNLISFFQKPRNQAVLEALAAQVQELEGELWDLNQAFDIEDAEGQQLDFIGRLVGEARQGRTDTDYRKAVKVRILTNGSQGTHEELLAIVAALEPATTSTFTEYYPSAVRLDYTVLGATTLAEIHRYLSHAKTAGVRLLLTAEGDDASVGEETPGILGGLIGSVGDSPTAGFVIGNGY